MSLFAGIEQYENLPPSPLSATECSGLVLLLAEEYGDVIKQDSEMFKQMKEIEKLEYLLEELRLVKEDLEQGETITYKFIDKKYNFQSLFPNVVGLESRSLNIENAKEMIVGLEAFSLGKLFAFVVGLVLFVLGLFGLRKAFGGGDSSVKPVNSKQTYEVVRKNAINVDKIVDDIFKDFAKSMDEYNEAMIRREKETQKMKEDIENFKRRKQIEKEQAEKERLQKEQEELEQKLKRQEEESKNKLRQEIADEVKNNKEEFFESVWKNLPFEFVSDKIYTPSLTDNDPDALGPYLQKAVTMFSDIDTPCEELGNICINNLNICNNLFNQFSNMIDPILRWNGTTETIEQLNKACNETLNNLHKLIRIPFGIDPYARVSAAAMLDSFKDGGVSHSIKIRVAANIKGFRHMGHTENNSMIIGLQHDRTEDGLVIPTPTIIDRLFEFKNIIAPKEYFKEHKSNIVPEKMEDIPKCMNECKIFIDILMNREKMRMEHMKKLEKSKTITVLDKFEKQSANFKHLLEDSSINKINTYIENLQNTRVLLKNLNKNNLDDDTLDEIFYTIRILQEVLRDYPKIVNIHMGVTGQITKFVGKFRNCLETIYTKYYIIKIKPRNNWRDYINKQVSDNS